MRARSAALVAVLLLLAGTASCGDDGGGDGGELASALCTSLQEWIDDVERTSKELSDRTTAEPDGAGRRRHFEAWGDAVLSRTERLRDDVEALDLPAPLTGLDDGIEILRTTREEIDQVPEPDPERLAFRIAEVFLAMENVFAKTRTSVERLGQAADDDGLAKALVDEPACQDYNDPLT